MLPAAGYLVIAWQADNPGVWLAHCQYVIYCFFFLQNASPFFYLSDTFDFFFSSSSNFVFVPDGKD